MSRGVNSIILLVCLALLQLLCDSHERVFDILCSSLSLQYSNGPEDLHTYVDTNTMVHLRAQYAYYKASCPLFQRKWLFVWVQRVSKAPVVTVL